MRVAALAIYALFAFFGLVLRALLQFRATGRSPIIVPTTPLAWLGDGLFTGGLFASPAGVAFGKPNGDFVAAIGVMILGVGVVGVVVAQAQMGASWRAGVDTDERTELVTNGLFAVVRNPIYACCIVAGAGMALVVSNVVTVVSAIAILAGAEVVVRAVEEPYLRRVHGDAFEAYAARSGRFVPSGGRRARR